MTIACKVTGEFAQNITCQLDEGQSMFADATLPSDTRMVDLNCGVIPWFWLSW